MTPDQGSVSSALRMQTEIFSHEGELVWSIKNCSNFVGYTLTSKEFSIVPCCQIKWKIYVQVEATVAETNISISRTDQKQKGKDSISRTERSGEPGGTYGEINCSLENSQGILYRSYFKKDYFESFANTFTLPRKIDILPKEDFIYNHNFTKSPDELLVIKFKIELLNCCSTTETIKCEYQNSFQKHKLSEDLHRGLEMLLNEKPLSDVNFNVNGTIIPAHKAILCARSPVFRKVLESNMKEAIEGVIEINDIDPEIMKEFISYLYTDTIGNEVTLDVICELYEVADKYEVGSLQDKCGSVLLENLNEKTVCKTLKLADLHSDDVLKEAASMYICENYPVLKHSSDFKSLAESDPRLVLHILMSNADFGQASNSQQHGLPQTPTPVPNYPGQDISQQGAATRQSATCLQHTPSPPQQSIVRQGQQMNEVNFRLTSNPILTHRERYAMAMNLNRQQPSYHNTANAMSFQRQFEDFIPHQFVHFNPPQFDPSNL